MSSLPEQPSAKELIPLIAGIQDHRLGEIVYNLWLSNMPFPIYFDYDLKRWVAEFKYREMADEKYPYLMIQRIA